MTRPSTNPPRRVPAGRARLRTRVATAAVAALVLGAGTATAFAAADHGSGRPPSATRATAAPRSAVQPAVRLFAADSPWNTPIPADPAIDPKSAAIQKAVLRNPSLVVNTILYAYGVPFYTATPSTPRVRLKGRGAVPTPIPIDPSWKPNEGADGKMNVIDPQQGKIYELQGYDRAKGSVYWVVVRGIDSSGDGAPSEGRQGPTGSGLTQAGGVIRLDEIRAGRIDHALSFITSNPAKGAVRYPATHTDGTNRSPGAIEEGMRIQLDPSLDLSKLGLDKAEYAIARALQVYGAYCTDNGRGNNMAMGFYAEQPTARTGDPYPAAGLVGDWAQLKKIPRSAYRVLAASVTTP